MHPLFFAQILPADSAAGSELKEAIGAATQPLNLDIKHWFSRSMLEEWLNAGINFGLRVILVLVLFWLGKVVITRLKKIFNGILRRRNIEGVAVSLLDFGLHCDTVHRPLPLLGWCARREVRILRCCPGLYGSGCRYGTQRPAAESRWRCHHHRHQALQARRLHLVTGY